MTPLLAVLFGTALFMFFVAGSAACFTTRAKIAGTYNRKRLLPNQIDENLRWRRKIQIIIWIVAAFVTVAVCAFLHAFYVQEILGGGFVYDALYTPFPFVGMSDGIRHPLIYLAWLILLSLGTWAGVRLGVQIAGSEFLLTRRLPAIWSRPAAEG